MKLTLVSLLLTAIMIVTGVHWGFAQNQTPTYKAEEIYAFFDNYSPKEIVDYVYTAVAYFKETANKAASLPKSEEEALFGKTLKEFNNLPLRFNWENYPFLPFVVPQRCDELRVVAHPVPQFFKVMSQVGFIKQYKDAKGEKIALEMCQNVTDDKAIWGFQYQWWPMTEKPLNMGVFLVQIPGTKYQIHAFYPTERYTKKQLNKLLEEQTR